MKLKPSLSAASKSEQFCRDSHPRITSQTSDGDVSLKVSWNVLEVRRGDIGGDVSLKVSWKGLEVWRGDMGGDVSLKVSWEVLEVPRGDVVWRTLEEIEGVGGVNEC